MERVLLAAVVLRTVDFGESDRVVTLLTEERGRLGAFARGARASRKRFGGALEPFTLLEASLTFRGSGDLPVLENVTVRRAFGAIREDLARIACASYACELARELLHDGEAHRELFALLVDYLSRLEGGPARPTVLRAFELGALAAVGLMPRLDACARCGRPPAPLPGGAIRFDVAFGGLLCGDCARFSGPGAVDAGAGTAMALLALQGGGLAAAEAAPLSLEAGREGRDLLGRFIEHQLGRRLNARRFLDDVAPMLGS